MTFCWTLSINQSEHLKTTSASFYMISPQPFWVRTPAQYTVYTRYLYKPIPRQLDYFIANILFPRGEKNLEIS